MYALEAGSQRLEVLGWPHPGKCLQAALNVREVVPSGGQDGPDFVVLEAADIAEIVLHAVPEKLLQLRIVNELRQREFEAGFHQNADHALSGAAERERVA